MSGSGDSQDNVTRIYTEILNRYPFLTNEEEKIFKEKAQAIRESNLPERQTIEKMLQELNNPHAEIRDIEKRTSQEIEALQPTHEIRDNCLYIRIPTWNSNIINESTVDKLIDVCVSQYDRYEGVVIDVRENNGGNSRLAQKLAAIFFKDDVEYGTTVNREGDQLTRYPCICRAHKQFLIDKPLVILTSPKCFSSNELYIAPHKISGRATLIGERTKGGSAIPHIMPVIIDNQEHEVFIPTRRLYLKGADRPLEETAIEPDIPYQGEDIVEFAIKHIKGQSGAKASGIQRAREEAQQHGSPSGGIGSLSDKYKMFDDLLQRHDFDCTAPSAEATSDALNSALIGISGMGKAGAPTIGRPRGNRSIYH